MILAAARRRGEKLNQISLTHTPIRVSSLLALRRRESLLVLRGDNYGDSRRVHKDFFRKSCSHELSSRTTLTESFLLFTTRESRLTSLSETRHAVSRFRLANVGAVAKWQHFLADISY
jgi:hypothetical protein